MTLYKNKLLIAGTAFALSALTTSMYAGGFQLYEQDAAGLGAYHAGGAAKADDASTEFYNPAGMVRLHQTEISSGLTGVRLSTHFQGEAGTDVNNLAPASGWGSTMNYIPNFHLVVPFQLNKHDAAFGFGVTTPYGLSTQYQGSTDTNAMGLAGTNTTIITVNVSPSLAYAITPKLSLGAGIDFMYGQADYNGDLGDSDSVYTNHLQGTGWGYNLGLLWTPLEHTRVGLAYRSHIRLSAHGISTAGAPGLLPTTTATAQFAIPASTELSVFQQVKPKWSIMASAMYTEWSIFKVLKINGMAIGQLDPSLSTDIENFDYKNSWFGAIGTQYQINDRNAVSVGFGYDQTPTRDGHRDSRLPDGNRMAYSIGWQYKVNCKMTFNVGYAYLTMQDAKIDNTLDKGNTVVKGSSYGHANILGLQLAYKF